MLLRVAAIFSLLVGPAIAEPVKVAAWNIEHLRAEENVGAVKRTRADFERLQSYAAELDADIIALQEVDGPEAAQRVFPSQTYNFFFSSRNNVQRTGFAVRRELAVFQNPDVEALGLDGNLRYGTDITVDIGGTSVRLLSVHLKSGCFEQPLGSGSNDCTRLAQQVPVLESWIDARAAEDIPFALLGDFNRRFDVDETMADPDGSLWREIDDGDPHSLDLTRANAGQTSQCWGGEFPVYIDHLVFDEQANGWVVSGSFEQFLFRQEHTAFRDVLSDHCAIAVTMDVPAIARADAQSIREPAGIVRPAEEKLDTILDRLRAIEERLDALAPQQ